MDKAYDALSAVDFVILGVIMFPQMPSFFPWANGSSQTSKPEAMFTGMPLVNPLLNDAQQNIETLDERIAQLESVAQWLNMNLQMVNSAVQQLQVQKQTILALAQWQAMSKDALGEWAKMKPFGTETPNQSDGTPTEPATPTAKKSKAAKKPITEPPKDTSQTTAEEPPPLKMPVAIEQFAQSWLEGLQNQFAQLAQPHLTPDSDAAPANEPPPTEPNPPDAQKQKAAKKQATEPPTKASTLPKNPITPRSPRKT
jgi:hypothetical protein